MNEDDLAKELIKHFQEMNTGPEHVFVEAVWNALKSNLELKAAATKVLKSYNLGSTEGRQAKNALVFVMSKVGGYNVQLTDLKRAFSMLVRSYLIEESK